MVWRLASLPLIKPHQEWGFVILVVAALAVGLTVFVLLSAAARKLFRHKDVLIPLGLYVSAEALLSALAAIPVLAAVLTPTWLVKLFGIAISLSLLFGIQLLLGIIYAGWTTTLILQAVRRNQVDPLRAFTDIGRWFLPVLGVVFFGSVVLFASVAVAIALGVVSIGLTLVLIGACSFGWNMATAALLPVAVAERGSFRAALAQGMQVSWARMGRWWLPVVVQMILLGWVTFIHVSYRSPGRSVTKTNWKVNAFCTGGYEDQCRWHNDLMEVVEAKPLPFVTTLLQLMFAVVAIIVKFRIVAGIYEPMPNGQEKPSALGLGMAGA